MSGQDWSVKISPASSGSNAVFTPDLLGAQPGEALQTENEDIVSWNNRTADSHWPWALQSNGQPYPDASSAKAAGVYLCDEIPAWESSTPGYVTTAPNAGKTTIDYICKLHPSETGSIVVSSTLV